MLGLGVFWRKPRTFEYKPRHFDAEKEAREERRKELCGENVEDELPGQEYRPGQYIRNNMYARRGIGASRRDRANNMRKYVIVAVLIFLIVIWMFY